MKRSKDLNKQRENFHREMQEAREERKFETELFKKHPYDQATGERLAKEFVDHTRTFADWMEKYRHMKPNDPAYQEAPKSDRPSEHEIEVFFTPEQRAELKAIYSKCARMTEIDNATAYKELLETLERAGLGINTLISEDDNEDIITVEVLSIAKAWWDNASKNAYGKDGEDDA